MESGDTLPIRAESPSRRVTRQSTKEHGLVLKPREPLRKRRKDAENRGDSVTAVNGSETQEKLPNTDDDEPPKKRRSMQTTEDEDDEADMDVQEDGDEQESDEDEEMSSGHLHPAMLIKESSVRLTPLKNVSVSTVGLDVNVGLRSRRSIHPTKTDSEMDTQTIKHSAGSSKRNASASIIPNRVAPKQDHRTEGQTLKSSIMDYHRKMEEGLSADHVDFPRRSRRVMDVNLSSNNIVHSKKPAKKAEYAKVPKPKTKAPDKGGASRIYTAILWLFLFCVSISVGVLAYQRVPWSSLLRKLAERSPSQVVSADVFSDRMSALEQRFRSQRGELWKRSRIYLQRHLQATEHTEPVIVILTAGQGAERTLGCLAAGLASAFSSAVNGSVLELDGASLAGKDGDQVKLDLDNRLREAFEGDKSAAVIHRLEELPPSSALIFYRYCDHENAAYKDPLLAFTVLLPLDEVGPGGSLKEAEEMVHDHIHQKFLVPNQPDTFDKMDVDKLSGLWSRISHLILPVNVEQHIEEGGCDRS